MNNPRIFADFHNADEWGRLRLNCVGTREDLSRQNIRLKENTQLILYSEELEVEAIVQYSEQENIWVAKIDWEQIREVDEESYAIAKR